MGSFGLAAIITTIIVLIFIGILIFAIVKGSTNIAIFLIIGFSVILTIIAIFISIFEAIMKWNIFFRFF